MSPEGHTEMPVIWRRFRLLFLGILSRPQSSLWSMSYRLHLRGSSSLSVWNKQRHRPLFSAASNPPAASHQRAAPTRPGALPSGPLHALSQANNLTKVWGDGLEGTLFHYHFLFSRKRKLKWYQKRGQQYTGEKYHLVNTSRIVYPVRRQTWFFLRGFMWQELEPTDSTPQ